MLRYAVERLIQAIIAIFGVLTIVFVVMHLSGDPTLLLVPQDASAEMIAQLRSQARFRSADPRAVSGISGRPDAT
uniref:hypothetical protein n=1 Tax=Neorhizobium sp. EC2-8 TaxID=3129230 RepID=UPI0031011F71